MGDVLNEAITGFPAYRSIWIRYGRNMVSTALESELGVFFLWIIPRMHGSADNEWQTNSHTNKALFNRQFGQ